MAILPIMDRNNIMPWSAKQHRLFEAAAHSQDVAKRVGIPMEQAQKMASEGVKNKPAKMAKALMTGKR